MDFIYDMFSSLCDALAQTPDFRLLGDVSLALLLGFLFGYERSYQGRAAGMRTYGLVCAVAAAVTSISMHPDYWLEGEALINYGLMDPTRTIQGIVMGVGFLGGGIIMQHSMRISGLTTAASIWAVAAVGIIVGSGMYIMAVLMTLLMELFILFGTRFDSRLPTRRPVMIKLQFAAHVRPDHDMIEGMLNKVGYTMAVGSIVISEREGKAEWRFVAISQKRRSDAAIACVAKSLPEMDGVESFQISRARN